jgi:A/G-specific adenine glycosylase
MLQQTQVKTVLPYWERWMRELPDIAALARARTGKLHQRWEGLGYYTRVRNMQRAAQVVLEKHGGRFPDDFAHVLELPGIGPYTAGAICSIAFNQPKPILDGNVVRVLTRLFGIAGNAREAATRDRLWQIAGDLVVRAARKASGERRQASDFNQAMMELGALVCTPRQPRCGDCPVAMHCVALQQDRVQELPRLGPRAPATSRRFVAFVAQRGERFLVRQRPAGVVNAHLWEFPNVEVGSAEATGRARSKNDAAAGSPPGLAAQSLKPFCTIKHSITRYRITMTVFRLVGKLPPRSALAKGKWLTRKQMSQLPFASAHKRILRQLGFE